MLTSFRSLFAPPRDLILVLAFIWLGSWLVEKRSNRTGIQVLDLNNLIFYSLLGFVIGGRIFFAIENIPAFLADPLSLISLNLDLFDPFGGSGTAFLIALAYGWRHNIPFWPTLDAITPLLAAYFIGAALANLASGNAFGKETSLPWGIHLWGAKRHPTQLYEFIASLLTICALLMRQADDRPGYTFLLFTALTSGWKLFLEAFRGDSALILDGLRLEQGLAWVSLAIALLLIERKFQPALHEKVATRNHG